MSTSTGKPPRSLKQLDEDFFAMCDDIKEIRRVQQAHSRQLDSHGAMLTDIQSTVGVINRDVQTLKTDFAELTTVLKTDMVEVKNVLGVIVSRLPER